MQQWEYKTLFRGRVWEQEKGKSFSSSTDWKIYIDQTLIEKSIDKILAELGQEGWELVTISPHSDYLGSFYTFENRILTGTGSIHIPSTDYAGFTTSETWMFKRLKS